MNDLHSFITSVAINKTKMKMRDYKADIVYKDKILNIQITRIFSKRHKYFVEVAQHNKVLATCEIGQNQEGHWDLLPPVPLWVSEIKQDLINVIK